MKLRDEGGCDDHLYVSTCLRDAQIFLGVSVKVFPEEISI